MPEREWESFDGKWFKEEQHKQGCKDIADQLLEHATSIDLVFAAGRVKFLPNSEADPKQTRKYGDRIDGRNLIKEWEDKMTKNKLTHKYIWNLTDFNQLKPNQYQHVLGLLSYSKMDYETERTEKGLL